MSDGEPLILVDQDMLEGKVVAFAGGEAAVLSTRSPGKETPNEDGAALITLGPTAGILAVADGMGGGPAGEQASRRALEALAESVRAAAGDDTETRAAVLEGIDAANRAVLELGGGAGTTLVVAEVEAGVVRPYHVGDSHLLVTGQRGKVRRLTVAHSPVGYGVAAGLLDAADAMHHEDRHLVSNVVGTADMHVELGSAITLQAHDTLLLGTDGLFDNLHVEEIVELVRAGPLTEGLARCRAACQNRMLTTESDRPSKPDDLTVLVFRRGRRALAP